MRTLLLIALLWAAAIVDVTRCSAQDVAAPQLVTIQELWDEVPDAPEGLPTGGTKSQDVLDEIPPFTGPLVQAAVVPAPPRFGRVRGRRAGRVQPPAATVVEAVNGLEPAAAATAAAAAAAAAAEPAQEWKVDVPVPHTAEELAALSIDADAVTVQNAPSTYQAVFDRHNFFRAWHTTPGLAWSSSLASSAANYAARCRWGHDPNAGAQGENLYAISGSGTNQATSLMNAINAWYDEYSLYSYSNPGFSSATGHFTQVVWKSTTALGCAVQACGSGFAGWSNGGVYVVCRYSPAGNVVNAGSFPANVLRRSANPPSTTPPPPPPANPPPPPSNRPPPPPANPPPPPANPPPPAVIPPGVLPQGMMISSTSSGPGCLVAQSQLYWICLYSDANMVLFSNGKAVWSTRTSGLSTQVPMKLIMMTSGALNIYDNANTLLWTTNTAGRGTAPRRFIMQNDGNALIADSANRATWATYTKGM